MLLEEMKKLLNCSGDLVSKGKLLQQTRVDAFLKEVDGHSDVGRARLLIERIPGREEG
jgi:hypothetical protein